MANNNLNLSTEEGRALFLERVDRRRADFHKSLDLCIDWLALILGAAPAEATDVGDVAKITDLAPFREAMIERMGQEMCDEFYVSAIHNIQEELIEAIVHKKSVTFCTAWEWAHHMYHLCYDKHDER